ncbi:MAG: hypothetical protein ISR65_19680 [Bacteriovoracaceae bacterium]|nr:hypothetical protein [Bacteriovoracaceae bacterium]
MIRYLIYVIYFTVGTLSINGLSAQESYHRVIKYYPLTLEPGKFVDIVSMHVLLQTSEGLVTYRDKMIAPAIAEKWSISNDLKKYTFKIREGARFSDGKPITAEDVIFSFTHIVKSKHPSAKSIEIISGVKSFLSGKSLRIEGLKKISDKKVQIEIDRPFAPFINILSSANYSISSEESLSKLNKCSVCPIPSSGAYHVVKVLPGKKVILKKNKYYYNAKNVFFNELTYSVVDNEKEAVDGFLSRKYNDIWPYSLREIEGKIPFKVSRVPSFTVKSTFLSLNLKKKPLDKYSVRKVLYDNVDIDGLLNELKLPSHYKAFGIIPRGMYGHINKQVAHNTNNILKMTESSDCTTKSPCNIEVVYRYKQNKEALTKLLAPVNKLAGYNVTLLKKEMKDFLKTFTSGSYTAILIPMSASYHDTYMLLKYLLDNKFSPPGLDRKEIRTLMEKAKGINNKFERVKLFEKVDKLLMNQIGIIPLYHGDRPYRIVATDISGYKIPFLGYPYLKVMNLKKK